MEKEILVLYVDDEQANLNAFYASFRKQYQVYTASSGVEAKKILETNPIAVLVTDQRMPEMSGSQLLAEAAKMYPNQMRILITAYSDLDALINAVNDGYIFKYLKKPWDEKKLEEAIEEAYSLYKHKIDLLAKEKKLDALKIKLTQSLDEELKNKLGLDDEVV